MLFWVLLIVSGLFAWLGVKKGLYAMFATLFCLMFSVYIGVLAAPRIIRLSHGLEQDPYYAAGCVFGMGLVIFILLWSIAYFFFIRDGEEYFPKMFERIGGGVCGFLFGYILTSLLMLLLCIMPFSRSEKLPVFCSRDEGDAIFRACSGQVLQLHRRIFAECFDG
jgi:uncharacterized membrane protein required for colicin V production